MLAIIFCIIGVSFAANEETATSSGEEASRPGLAEGRCVPTAVARGPCHQCICQGDGMFLCTTQEKCAETEKSVITGQECIPDMIFRDGILWCSCTSEGTWRSSNCQLNFRYLRSKTVSRTQSNYKNFTCDSNNKYYSVDCNICLCKNGKFEPASCTNRTCLKGNKADSCIPGQILKTENQLCACSQIGYYVDQLCVYTGKDSIVNKLTLNDLETLTFEEHSLRLNEQTEKKCVPDTMINKGCNICRCLETGRLICTQRKCPGEHPSFNTTNISRMPLKPNFNGLPEIKSLKEKCVPGQAYRYSCNKCVCTKKEVPICTNMLCVDDYFSNKLSSPLTHQNSEIPKLELKLNDKKTDCIPGKAYKQNCNTCICTKNQHLLCSKAACLTQKEQIYLNIMEKEKLKENTAKKSDQRSNDDRPITKTRMNDDHLTGMKKTNKDTDHKDALDKNKRHKRSDKRNTEKRSDDDYLFTNKQSLDDDEDEAKPGLRSYDEFPLLPNKKCSPGVVYSKSEKSCQRCFCNEKRVAMCTDRPCREMRGPVQVPEDVYPSIDYAKIDTMPSLPHEAAPCHKGRLYSVDCNPCLCLANGNLLCGNLLCLSINEAKKYSAVKYNEKPCKKGDPAPAECINCECQKGKYNCEPIQDCTPYKQFLRYLDDGNEGNSKSLRVNPSYHLKENGTCIPKMMYRIKCNRCFCQEDGSLRCTRRGCLNYVQTNKLKKQRHEMMKPKTKNDKTT